MGKKRSTFINSLFSVMIIGILLIGICIESKAENSNIYYLGETVNAGKNTGFSEKNKITEKDPHYNWELGNFYVDGFTRAVSDNTTPLFLKTVGDKVVLKFKLKQNIDALNGDETLEIAYDKKGYDFLLQKEEMEFGRGTLIIRKTDAYKNEKSKPQIYTNYLDGIKKGANTQVEICEEGDYEVALDYSVRDKKITIPVFNKTIRSTYHDYRTFFKFSVRNGNCMVFPFDVSTGEELTNKSITENGFYLDLAKSRYLDINVKKEILKEGATGITEDIRFNKPACDGEEYTEEGVYTITVSNPYTKEETVKRLYVGTNNILKAYMVTGNSISDIQSLVENGATINDNGEILLSSEEHKSDAMIETKNPKEDLDVDIAEQKNHLVGGKWYVILSIAVVMIAFIVISLLNKRKHQELISTPVPIDPEEIDEDQCEESISEDTQRIVDQKETIESEESEGDERD